MDTSFISAIATQTQGSLFWSRKDDVVKRKGSTETRVLRQRITLPNHLIITNRDIWIFHAFFYPDGSGKDGKPDSWFLFDLYKRKRNPVTKVQESVPEMSHISHLAYKILHRNA